MCSSPCEFLGVLLICLLSVSSFFCGGRGEIWEKRKKAATEFQLSLIFFIFF